MRSSLLLGLLVAGSSLAGEPAAGPGPVPERAVGRWMQPSAAPLSADARIFLVAGARDIANFAQEVVDQRRLWLSRGYTPEQIECFFAAPPPQQTDDAGQFLALEESLLPCHLASPREVLAALKEVAREYPADHFYLYLSSHGTPPVLGLPEPVVRSIDPQASWLPQALAEARADKASQAYQWLAPFQVSMEGIRLDSQRWGWASYFARLYQSRITSDMDPREHMFTPALLADALQAFPASVRKVVVIQACYSGGFVLPPKKAPAPEETLRNVKKTTVITAARADRTSFGCDSSGETTLFGGSFHKVLESHPDQAVPQLNWRKLHRQVAKEVEQLEQQAGISSRQRSEPQFYYGR
ncbi:MAG TPA: C13 family peptidase [Steroidobacteraceae bacterium]|nr:C13 family peptidase [Steroidobacteraceae bacterium]